MRGPLGFGGRRLGGGGGDMLRSASRAITRTGVGIQEPFSHSPNPTSPAAASSAPTSPRTASSKLNISSSAPSSPFAACPPVASPDYDWVFADDDFLLGSVPSADEVHCAVSAMQQVFDSTYPQFVGDDFRFNSDIVKDISASGLLYRVSSTGSDSDWIEPDVHLSNWGRLPPFRHERVADAFHMLQSDPSVQRMVVSLSTDSAVWEAVMNNEAVRELRDSCKAAEMSNPSGESYGESSIEVNPVLGILRQMFNDTKAKFMDMVEKITELISEIFKPPPHPLPPSTANEGVSTGEGTNNPMERKIRASFMLSVVVLLIVVASRGRGA